MFLTSPYIDQAIALIDSIAGGGAVERRASGRALRRVQLLQFLVLRLGGLEYRHVGIRIFP
jgi:hypothetical protein